MYSISYSNIEKCDRCEALQNMTINNELYLNKRKCTFQSEYSKVSFRSKTRVNICCSRGCKSGRSFSEEGSANPYNQAKGKKEEREYKKVEQSGIKQRQLGLWNIMQTRICSSIGLLRSKYSSIALAGTEIQNRKTLTTMKK